MCKFYLMVFTITTETSTFKNRYGHLWKVERERGRFKKFIVRENESEKQ